MRLLIIINSLFFCNTCFGQNLVKNPSFEDFNICPQQNDYKEFPATDWEKPHIGTSDYYHSCSNNIVHSVPINNMGYYPAHSGQAYSGIIPIAPDGYMEHLQGQLKDTLRKGAVYNVSFWVRVADSASYYFTWKIGASLSKHPILTNEQHFNANRYQDLMAPAFIPHIERGKGEFITDTNWVKVEGEYVAKGGEKYITIGCFYDDCPELLEQLDKYYKKRKKSGKESKIPFFLKYWLRKNQYVDPEKNRRVEELPYYFVDDVSVELKK